MPEAEERLYRTMAAIRGFETSSERLLKRGELTGNVHLSIGQEAVAAGVCDVLRPDDHITTTHRGHGHCLAKGGDPERMYAELLGRSTGYCGGKAGSMHIADPATGNLGATAIVGGGIAMAAGAALSAQVRGTDQVAVAFFGEGAVAEGSFHEALNLAAVWQLPLLLVCENNGYAELTPASVHLRAPVHRLAEPHGVPGELVDGNDALAVRAAADEAVLRARAGGGPTLLECTTYRWSGHYVGDPERYRTPEEVAGWKERDPVARLAAVLEPGRAAQIDAEVEAALAGAAERALAQPMVTSDALLEHVWS
ncbi:MAG: 2-oxoisovalerate dehydrogenase component [Solirubrobacteraceae bacterium]|jgi:TPP-dependent pyruvate/acetoin dehydrogenase alpha subunit|nr:2-oxoisovalerate dehydrogenase component [Solirubrobacteraceae bacterium]